MLLRVHVADVPRFKILRMFPFRPRIGSRWENSYASTNQHLRVNRYFGGPADSGSPVALRPPLARGLPFSTAFLLRQWTPADPKSTGWEVPQPVGNPEAT